MCVYHVIVCVCILLLLLSFQLPYLIDGDTKLSQSPAVSACGIVIYGQTQLQCITHSYSETCAIMWWCNWWWYIIQMNVYIEMYIIPLN